MDSPFYVREGLDNEYLDRCETELVYRVGSQDAGYVAFTVEGGEVHTWMIAVHPEHQRQGIATALLRELAERHPGTVLVAHNPTPEGMALLEAVAHERANVRATLRAAGLTD